MIFDTEDWSIADQYDASSDSRTFGDAEYNFASAFAALKLGNTEQAETFVANASSAGPLSDDQIIYKHQLQGMLAQLDGENEAAEEHLVLAVDHEASLPFEFGPPTYVKPTFELLGQFYLEIGRLDDAREAFQAQLDRTPHRLSSVTGLNAATERGSN
jgi:tetratricopeptide (TPR) repeat protein